MYKNMIMYKVIQIIFMLFKILKRNLVAEESRREIFYHVGSYLILKHDQSVWENCFKKSVVHYLKQSWIERINIGIGRGGGCLEKGPA